VLAQRDARGRRRRWSLAAGEGDWNGELVRRGGAFVTGIGAGTTYPDYKPAPFIVSLDASTASTWSPS
jgi:hypothetical protein